MSDRGPPDDDSVILVVDGKPLDLQALSAVLQHNGHDVRHVAREAPTEQSESCLEERIRQRTEELQRANDALLEVKAQFEAVYNHHYQLTGLLDTEGRLLMGNRTALQFAGVEERDVAGMPFWETPWWTHSEEEQRKLREAFVQALAGEFVRFESTHISHAGDTRVIDFCISPVFDDDGSVIYLVPEGHDITDRIAAEASLRRSEARYRATIENAADAFFLIDALGTIVDVNQRACDNLGYRREELLSMHLSDVEQALQEDQIHQIWSALTADSKVGASLTVEGIHQRSDRTTFPVEVRVGLLEVGNEALMLALVRDITERRQAEEERDRLEAQLQQAQKMEAVGQLAGGVAHDFNNLLQAILGHGELAMTEADPGSAVLEDLAGVMKAGRRATALVQQLLAFSRRQVLKLEILNLDEVVQNLAAMIRPIIGDSITFDLRADSGVQTVVRADRGQLEQIIMNLCVNGRDAMPEGGRLSIGTESTELDETFCHQNAWARPGRFALLSVGDTGCGMDEETRRRIFEPFFTTKAEGSGTGLGLSTVYGIVRQHDGLVHVSSEVGQGTTFTIYLPLATAPTAAVPDDEVTRVVGGTEVILLAEGDDKVRAVTVRFLEDAGYTVLRATDGEQAIRIFDRHAAEVDLVLLDVGMPRANGRVVYDHIRASGAQTPVLFSSGYGANGVHTDFVLDQGMELIQKPYTRNDLLRRVRHALDS